MELKDLSAIAEMSAEDNVLTENYIKSAEDLASIVSESVYVFDLATQRFRFVAGHGLILCGHSQEAIIFATNHRLIFVRF
ncbi:hypothetical protein FACS189430_03580 [Bacteroidia bacterium]|nr:hypothetical protein FACS189430_03580 [Bacteroidia bacterium]